jgi:hypothetical protein
LDTRAVQVTADPRDTEAGQEIPENSNVIIDGSKSKIIDYDIYEILRDFQISAKEKNIKLTLKGITINKI